jgi:hypothetical protein
MGSQNSERPFSMGKAVFFVYKVRWKLLANQRVPLVMASPDISLATAESEYLLAITPMLDKIARTPQNL